MSAVSKIIFPNLNAYRFIAALLVVFHHVEQIRYNAHLFNFKQYSLFNNGAYAVQFFFVLSGFLITYLLLVELANTKTVSLSTFYLKRILRIWPLYYLLVFVGFVILPLLMFKQGTFSNKFPYLNYDGLMLYVFILPNVANAIWSKHFLISLWSIGVEEQFYLFWSPIVKWLENKVVYVCFTLVVVRLMFDAFFQSYFSFSPFIQSIINSLRFDCMAIGALAAFWFQKGISDAWKNIIYSIYFECIVLAFLAVLFIFRIYLRDNGIILESPIGLQLISLLFAFLILNGATNPTTIFKISFKWIDYLGSISFGIYMYHMIFVFFGVELLKKLQFMNGMSLLSTIFVYSISVGMTIFVSFVSYKFVEFPIIQLRSKKQ